MLSARLGHHVQRVFDNALEEARATKAVCGTQHLVVGLMIDTYTPVAHILGNHGVSLDRLATIRKLYAAISWRHTSLVKGRGETVDLTQVRLLSCAVARRMSDIPGSPVANDLHVLLALTQPSPASSYENGLFEGVNPDARRNGVRLLELLGADVKALHADAEAAAIPASKSRSRSLAR